jgi:DNA-binding transcriptional LysR family regulator
MLRWRFAKGGDELQLDVEGPITLDEASLARIAALNGVGIGYFMESDFRDDIAAGRLIRILDDWTPPLAPLCLYYSNRRNSSAAFQAFIALARDMAAGR